MLVYLYLKKKKELEFIRESVNKGRPLGDNFWLDKVVKKFRLEMTVRNPEGLKTVPDTFFVPVDTIV